MVAIVKQMNIFIISYSYPFPSPPEQLYVYIICSFSKNPLY